MKFPRTVLLFPIFTLFLFACSTPMTMETSPDDLVGVQVLLPGDYVGVGSRGDVYHSILKLDLPVFGGEIFYHHISLESIRGPAIQRKLYRFEDAGRSMRSTVILGGGDAIVDPQVLSQQLSTLPEAQLLRFPDGCQFQWRRVEDGFVAEVSRDECRYNSPAFGGLVSPEMEYQLSRCGLVISEGIYRQDGSPVFPPSITDNKRANTPVDDC